MSRQIQDGMSSGGVAVHASELPDRRQSDRSSREFSAVLREALTLKQKPGRWPVIGRLEASRGSGLRLGQPRGLVLDAGSRGGAHGACVSPRLQEEPAESRHGLEERRRSGVREVPEVGRVLDPLVRVLAAACPQGQGAQTGEPRGLPAILVPEMQQMLRRVAWGGDRNKGVAYLEFGSGELSGAKLTVQSDLGELSVTLELPAGVPRGDWRERLEQRLARRGLNVGDVTVL